MVVVSIMEAQELCTLAIFMTVHGHLITVQILKIGLFDEIS